MSGRGAGDERRAATGCAPVANAFAAGAGLLQPGQAIDDRQVAVDRQSGRRALRPRARAAHGRERRRRQRRSDPLGHRASRRDDRHLTETAGGVTVAVLAELARRGDIDPDERVVLLITGDGLKTLECGPRQLQREGDRADGRRFRPGLRDGGRLMAARVKIPTQLRAATGGVSEATGGGETRWARCSTALFEEFGELRERISDERVGLRRFVNVYLAGEDIRFLDGIGDQRSRRRRADDPPGGSRWLSHATRSAGSMSPRRRTTRPRGPTCRCSSRPDELDDLIERLRTAPLGEWRAKDVLRAARLPLLGPKQSEEVAEKLAKVRAKEPLSPILIVAPKRKSRVQIADGYHRTCAAYLAHEDTFVPGRILFR